MSRLGGRRSLTVATAVVAVLVTPAAASAASYTIKPGDGACGGGDLACGGLLEGAPGPAVLVTGGHDGLQFSDAAVLSKHDDGIFISTGTENRVTRTIAATGGTQESAIYVESNAGSPVKRLTVDSTVTNGGLAGIGAKTRSALLQPG